MSHQVGSYSPPPRRELYSPPPTFDPLTSDEPESSEPTASEASESAEVPYRPNIYTPPTETRFVAPPSVTRFVEPGSTVSWPTPVADSAREPEAPPRSTLRSICNNQLIGGSTAIGGMITLAIGVGVIFSIKSVTAALATGISLIGVGVVAIAIGIVFMARMDT